jgi:hypothetical protein
MNPEQEPHWALGENAWGQPKGRYYFDRKRGWCCNHCGGLFRGKAALLEHQARVIAAATPTTTTPLGG